MQISIEYCNQWNYLPRASSLAAEIKNQFQVDAKLIPGSGGIFDVKVNDKLVFSKHEVGRHAMEGEVMEILNKVMAEH